MVRERSWFTFSYIQDLNGCLVGKQRCGAVVRQLRLLLSMPPADNGAAGRW